MRGFKVIWRQSPKVDGNGHFCHRIAFGPDGLLYLTSGERQKFTPAQDLGGNLGKVLRLTAEGAPAPGNPWASKGGVAAQFWSIGHRNLLGLAFAPDGRLWESEMGPKGGDELNLIGRARTTAGPTRPTAAIMTAATFPITRPGDGFEPPKAWWNPSISPGGLMIYTGNKFPAWKGDALVPGAVGRGADPRRHPRRQGAQGRPWPMGERIRAVDEGPDGSV